MGPSFDFEGSHLPTGPVFCASLKEFNVKHRNPGRLPNLFMSLFPKPSTEYAGVEIFPEVSKVTVNSDQLDSGILEIFSDYFPKAMVANCGRSVMSQYFKNV